MSSDSIREQVHALLTPIYPDGWTVNPYTVKGVDQLAKTTGYLEHTGIDPEPGAPIGCVRSTVILSVFSHLTDYRKAEDRLDVPVMEFLTALDGLDTIAFTTAQKTTYKDTYLGWAITLTVLTEKEPTS
ncbi:hypothetical protein [Microbacterium schleiferi]|uniref:Tail terminator n=1 Tax=Microbacterium schleiferi TaxID=69362 RepID=A0ABU7V7G9_9MICO